jgi:hypothetical protein
MTLNPDFKMIVRMVLDKQIGSVHLSREGELFPICGFPNCTGTSAMLGVWQVDFIGPVKCERCLHIAGIRPEVATPVLPGLQKR